MLGGYYYGETYLGDFGGIVIYTLIVSDSVSTTDSRVAIIRLNKNDTPLAVDSISKTLSRPLADSASISDAIKKIPTLKKAEVVSTADSIVKSITLQKSDVATATSVFSRAIFWLRSFVDAYVIADDIVKTIRMNKAESVTVTDVLGRNYTVTFSDSIFLSDIFNAAKLTSIIRSIMTGNPNRLFSDATDDRGVTQIGGDRLVVDKSDDRQINNSASDKTIQQDGTNVTIG